MIQTFAMLFIIYEITKIVFPEKYIKLLLDMKNLNKAKSNKPKNKQEIKKMFISRYSIVFFIELVYLVFVASLIFTSYWFVGLLLIVLALVHKERLSAKAMINDSVISIIVLMLVFFV